MKCQELVSKLKDNGIDIHEERFVLGIDCHDCGDRFEKNNLGYVHIVKGDRDNGKVYLSTENSVKSSLKIQSLLLEISASFLEAFFCGLCPHPPLVGEAGKQHLTASRHTG